MTQATAFAPESRHIDLSVVRAGLRSGTAPSAWMARWLEIAYLRPEQFLQTLYTYAGSQGRGLKSTPAGATDLYHDTIVTHLGTNKRAFVSREAGQAQSLSYEALHVRAGALASAWRAAGMKPGMCVALLLPQGPQYVVALLAALRLGLVIGPIPPHGPAFVATRLALLAPDALVLSSSQQSLVSNASCPILPLFAGRESSAPISYSYAPDAPVLRLFPGFGGCSRGPFDLAAAPLHAALLCDGTTTFALDAGDTLAAPGFDALSAQPTLLLAVLLAGGTWAELTPHELQTRPTALAEFGVTLLGVVPEVRDVLLSQSEWPKGSLRAWFRSLTDPLEFVRWDAWGRRAAAAGLTSFNVAFSTTAGGALLFGPTLKASPNLEVWPVPGRSWQLSELAGGLLKSLNDTGVFTPLSEDLEIPGVPRLLLARDGVGYVCSGSIELGPSGRIYPVEEVAALVERLPLVRHASVVVSPGSLINSANISLLVFSEGMPPEFSEVPFTREAIVEHIAREMGKAFVPTRVELLPLKPRITGNGLDHAWCRSQYLNGALTQKSRTELFLLLSRLGYLLDTPMTND